MKHKTPNTRKYIFNVRAINIVPEAIAGAYENKVKVIEATDIEDALKQAEERWKRNEQFRFEYKYVGCGVMPMNTPNTSEHIHVWQLAKFTEGKPIYKAMAVGTSVLDYKVGKHPDKSLYVCVCGDRREVIHEENTNERDS